MDFEALQAARESCRVYSDRPVPREALAHLVDVARLAPSGCNAQPWRFIIIDEPEARAKLIEALDDDGLTGCPWGDRVPNFILICEDGYTFYSTQVNKLITENIEEITNVKISFIDYYEQ